MVLVRLAVRCALVALLCDSPLDGTARPDHHPNNNVGTVRQAHVNPRRIFVPIVGAKDIRFTRLSTDQGLSQTRVIQIVQDDQGFMWFGSQYGLNRYDGYKFGVQARARQCKQLEWCSFLSSSKIVPAHCGLDAMSTCTSSIR